MTFTINTFATFAGSFTFTEGKQLSIEQVQGGSGASTVSSATTHALFPIMMCESTIAD